MKLKYKNSEHEAISDLNQSKNKTKMPEENNEKLVKKTEFSKNG